MGWAADATDWYVPEGELHRYTLYPDMSGSELVAQERDTDAGPDDADSPEGAAGGVDDDARTRNPLTAVTVSELVMTLKVLAPGTAFPAMTISKVRWNGSLTLMFDTVIPLPEKVTLLIPSTKLVNCPAIITPE